jgi:hypothetical protein
LNSLLEVEELRLKRCCFSNNSRCGIQSGVGLGVGVDVGVDVGVSPSAGGPMVSGESAAVEYSVSTKGVAIEGTNDNSPCSFCGFDATGVFSTSTPNGTGTGTTTGRDASTGRGTSTGMGTGKWLVSGVGRDVAGRSEEAPSHVAFTQAGFQKVSSEYTIDRKWRSPT